MAYDESSFTGRHFSKFKLYVSLHDFTSWALWKFFSNHGILMHFCKKNSFENPYELSNAFQRLEKDEKT